MSDELAPMGVEEDTPYARVARQRRHLQIEHAYAREELRRLWATIVELGQSLVADDAMPRVVDAALLIEWATEHLANVGGDLTGDRQLAYGVARDLWATVGAKDYAEWLQIEYNYPDGGEIDD